jgi:transposase
VPDVWWAVAGECAIVDGVLSCGVPGAALAAGASGPGADRCRAHLAAGGVPAVWGAVAGRVGPVGVGGVLFAAVSDAGVAGAVRRRPEAHPRRAIVDAIRYVVDNGCKWRALPADFPPWQTVYGFFARWAAAGVVDQLRDQLHRQVRATLGRCPKPVTAIMDSQSVKAAETVGRDTRGFDGAKLITAASGAWPWTLSA